MKPNSPHQPSKMAIETAFILISLIHNAELLQHMVKSRPVPFARFKKKPPAGQHRQAAERFF
ncbi:hypothetical protein [Geobacillus kaustophilus]|uniref:hypothetical protein n=1 Tax=Geobacillus kaustophilus TaxID=1462 RepID=UPI0005CCDA4B|nr:hypothetical protein [Geobacillus kaustophilus]